MAADFGLTESAVKTAVHRLRQRFGAALRDEIAETVADPGDVDEEVRQSVGVLAEWAGAARNLPRAIRLST